MNDHEFELLLRHRDGQADQEQSAQVNELLRRDPEARAMLRSLAVQATAMADLAATIRFHSPPQRAVLPIERRRWTGKLAWLAAAAIIMLLGIVGVQEFRHREPAVLTLEAIHGAVSWSNDRGELLRDLGAGATLRTGTISTEDDEATAQVRFADGTRLTLSGSTRLTFSDAGQKRLTLQEGSFSAEVSPQPAKRPMVVRTRTAEVEVIGTVFTLASEAERTALNVDKGSVQFRRLLDDRTVQVGEKQTARASLEGAIGMRAEPQPATPKVWRSALDSPPDDWKGRWLPKTSDEPARVAAIPRAVGRRPHPESLVQHCVVVGNLGRPLTRIESGSVITVRYRVNQPHGLRVFAVLHNDNRWAGNIERNTDAQEFPPDAAGWRTATVRFEDMIPTQGTHKGSPSKGSVMMLMIATQNDVGLEVAVVSILSKP